LDDFTVKMFDDRFPEWAHAIRQQQQLGRKTVLFRHDYLFCILFFSVCTSSWQLGFCGCSPYYLTLYYYKG